VLRGWAHLEIVAQLLQPAVHPIFPRGTTAGQVIPRMTAPSRVLAFQVRLDGRVLSLVSACA
jgi:hypothetical protein